MWFGRCAGTGKHRVGLARVSYNARRMSAATIPSSRVFLPRCSVSAHCGSLLILVVATSLLVVAGHLDPSARGVGTHLQLGLPACGFLVKTTVPCATCGMTTAFALAAEGELVAAMITQPMGAALAVTAAASALVSAYALVAGLSLAPLVNALWQPRPVLVAAGFAMASWVYKIAVFHAGS